ncbi:MAG: tRNA (guanosine(46)-N7)-methyltransferase TrmB [Rhodobacteraceae bacterium]|nr:tRNA (guanosine(46)-N7)-methyltransferase TrmB [Paracoccaceae bacterium]
MQPAKLRSAVPGRNFYGRVKGKTLKPAQEKYLAEDLPRLQMRGVTVADNPARATLDPRDFFGDDRPLWLEIGFGGGEHMLAQALANPDAGMIGCEPFLNGVAMALGRIRRAGAENIRLHPGDVRDLFDVLPDACLARAFLLYPDPWPKARHHRRRFVTPEHLRPLARVLRPGAEFRIATDIPDYVRQTLEEVPQAGFRRVDHPMDAAWPDWTRTRYEAKALREGRAPHYLTFLRA